VIYWKDFIMDDVMGAHFAPDFENVSIQVCRKTVAVRACVMDDAKDGYTNEAPECASIQETRQEHEPARMVGLSSLDSARAGMEAGRSGRNGLRQRESG